MKHIDRNDERKRLDALGNSDKEETKQSICRKCFFVKDSGDDGDCIRCVNNKSGNGGLEHYERSKLNTALRNHKLGMEKGRDWDHIND